MPPRRRSLIAYPIIERLRLLHHRSVVAAIGGTLLTDTLALLMLAMTLQTAESGEGWLGWAGPMLMFGTLVAVSLAVVPRFGAWFLQQARAGPAEKALFLLTVLLVLAAAADVVDTGSMESLDAIPRLGTRAARPVSCSHVLWQEQHCTNSLTDVPAPLREANFPRR